MFKLDVLEVTAIHGQLCAGSEGLWVVHDTPGDVIWGHLFLLERNSQKMYLSESLPVVVKRVSSMSRKETNSLDLK